MSLSILTNVSALEIQQYLLKNMAGENQAKLKRYFEDSSKVCSLLGETPCA